MLRNNPVCDDVVLRSAIYIHLSAHPVYREFTMQVQDTQKALISDTAIHSNERLSPFTPIERVLHFAGNQSQRWPQGFTTQTRRRETTKTGARPAAVRTSSTTRSSTRGSNACSCSVVGRQSRFSTACFTKTVDIPSVTRPSTVPFTPDWVKSGKQKAAPPWQSICAACDGDGCVGSRILLSVPVPAVGAWDEREHQRLVTGVFPKHQDIAQFSDEYMEKVVSKLNNRPRKCLQ